MTPKPDSKRMRLRQYSGCRHSRQLWRKLLIGTLVVLAVPYLASAVYVPRRSLEIHGPFEVNSGDLKAGPPPVASSAIPIPPLEEKKTVLLHFVVKGSHIKDYSGPPTSDFGHPSQVPEVGNKKYTPDSGWVIDTSRGDGGYSIAVNDHLGVIEGPKIELHENTLTVRGEIQSWGVLDATITIYLKSTTTTYTDPIRTPRATRGFIDVAGLGGIDPGIAVGHDYILLCDNSTGVAVYDKAGNLLGPKSNESAFPNPFTMSSLFSKIKADFNQKLNYPPGLPPGYDNEIRFFGDIRVMFDPYRKRFWIYAEAENKYSSAEVMGQYPALKLIRRDKAAVAVSKTEDPREGFYTYWWNGTVHNGDCNEPQDCNKPKGCGDPDFKVSGEGADYPSIGISPKYFLATIGVDRRDPCFAAGDAWNATTAQAWLDCKIPFEQDGQTFDTCGPFYVHIMVVGADVLAAGGGPLDGRSFGLFLNANNYLTDRTATGEFASGTFRGLRPVFIHGAAGTTLQEPTTGQSADAYFVNHFIDRSGAQPKCYLVLWSLVGDNLNPTLYPFDDKDKFEFDSWWQVVLNACYRDGQLYATFGHDWQPTWATNSSPSIRVVHVNTLTGDVKNRSFGRNNLDDNPSALFAYPFPGIQVNKNGDIVLVYTRYTFDNFLLKQEVRFTVWYHNEPDVRPSRVLKLGEALYTKAKEVYSTGTDTAGIAVDPSDDEAIWIAHIFAAADKDGYATNRIAFGKIFGKP